jgi:hypothetical protein
VHAAVFQQRLDRGRSHTDNVLDPHGFCDNIHFAGFDLGEVQKAVDEFEQMFRADENFLKIFLLQIWNLVSGSAQNDTGKANDGV